MENKWFVLQQTGQVFKITHIVKDFQEYPYILLCKTLKDNDIYFMASEFTSQYKHGKIRKTSSINKIKGI